MNTLRILSTTISLGTIVVCAAVSGCGAAQGVAIGGANSNDAKVRVTPIKPVRKTLTRYVEQPGQIAALEEAPIYAKVSGYVKAVHVDIGDQVTGPMYEENKLQQSGDLLLEIEVPELEQDLAQKEASIEQAKSEIAQFKAAVKVAEAMRDSAQAAVDEAEANRERVDADHQRWKSESARITELGSRQTVSEKVVDETLSKLRAAAAALKEVEAKIQSAKAHFAESEAVIEKAQADVAAAQSKLGVATAERDRAETLRAFSQIRAPFSGVVAERNVDTGHLVNVGSSAVEPLLVVVRTETVRIFVDVPEVDAVHIEKNAEANIRVPSLPGDAIEGTVTRSTWVLDQATRTLRTEIDVENASGRLRPGMYAYARLKVAERPDAVTLPKSALLTGGGQTYCWRIEADGTLRKNVLTTGIESGGEYEIVSGLAGEEDIIGVNAASFREGQQIEIVPAKG